MKLASILFTAAVAAVAAQEPTVAPVAGGNPPAPVANTPAAPNAGSPAGANTNVAIVPAGANTNVAPLPAGANPLDSLKAKTYKGDTYHMQPVRVVHARVQSDAPIYVKDRFVSSFGGGDLEKGYLSGMDNVNTASVEGALMYVQAECININSRAPEERCVRKNKVQHIVFYEILIAQTNETIAQFQDPAWQTNEYGPMIPMDSGRCTPLEGDDKFPPGCLQFNGEKGQPNLGPFVGGESKADSDRAPYPDNYWFSFPHTCPTKIWKEKDASCRSSTRKGLCPIGQAPDGVDCTFAYNILGWVPIDDVVGITSELKENGEPYKNFTEWCMASDTHIEFIDDGKHDFKDGIPFWKDPLDKDANKARAEKVLLAYESLVANKNSTQVESEVIGKFQLLPTPDDLAKVNPPCYKSVKACGSGSGCKRVGFSQICTPCKDGEKCPTGDDKFKFPELAKAPTTLSEDEIKTDSSKLNDGMSGGKKGGKDGQDGKSSGSSASSVSMAAATVVASLLVSAFAL